MNLKNSMNVKKIVLLQCRIPGLILLEALKSIVSLPHNKQWAIEVGKGNKVTYACQCEKSGKKHVVNGVNIKVVDAVVPEQFYGKLELELTVTGLINTTLAARTFLADFDKIGNEIVAALKDHHGKPFRVHDHGELHLAVN